MFRIITESSENHDISMIVCKTPSLDEAYRAFKDACKNQREGVTVILCATIASDGPDAPNA